MRRQIITTRCLIAAAGTAMLIAGAAAPLGCPAEEGRDLPSTMSLEVSINGQDADGGSDLLIPVDEPIVWTYAVSNTGDLTLTNLAVSDTACVVDCPKDALEPGETMTCTGLGTALAGPQTSAGTATGTSPTGGQIAVGYTSQYLGVTPSIRIEKQTNGNDAETPPGPLVAVGGAVQWTYAVTNTGDVELTDVTVADSEGMTVSCPGTSLQPGESMTCTASGRAVAGQYSNVGTATGTAFGRTVTADDASHYRGVRPSITLNTRTSGEDADLPPGPSIAVDSTIEWTYVVTNTGNIGLREIAVTDDQGVVVTCPKTVLARGESMTCTGSGIAVAGQYSNVGVATGKAAGRTVTASDVSHYLGVASSISIEKLTNGEDADVPPGPQVQVGSMVQWTYVVTNTGEVALTDIVVTDDQGVAVTCPKTALEPAESMTCTGAGIAIAGQYSNVGIATALPPAGPPVTASDASNYLGITPSITLMKLTNGDDANAPPGPLVPAGDMVQWTYVVTNTGNIVLTDVVVNDDQGVAVTCPKTVLAPAESMTCVGAGIAIAGQYFNVGTVIATSPVGPPVVATDVSHYMGAAPFISLETLTNGQDADVPPGPSIAVGNTVQWTYVVTNTGNIVLTDVVVSDDQGVAVACPKTVLAPAESMTCTGSGTAVADQYSNVGTAIGTPPVGPPVTASDPSHHRGILNYQGCTPGYWKNHTDSWPPTGYSPSQKINTVFVNVNTYYSTLGNATLLQSLGFGGGSGNQGAAEILLRAATAALMNASHPNVVYPRTASQVISDVNSALLQNRDAMLSLAAELDADNNRGCPLN